jgi:hypothetical protein
MQTGGGIFPGAGKRLEHLREMNINLAQAGRAIQTEGEFAMVKELQGLKPGLI